MLPFIARQLLCVPEHLQVQLLVVAAGYQNLDGLSTLDFDDLDKHWQVRQQYTCRDHSSGYMWGKLTARIQYGAVTKLASALQARRLLSCCDNQSVAALADQCYGSSTGSEDAAELPGQAEIQGNL